MVRLSKLFIVNACAFVLLALQIISGGWIYIAYLEKLAIPHGVITFHPINGFVLIVVIILHLYMNKRWIATQLKS